MRSIFDDENESKLDDSILGASEDEISPAFHDPMRSALTGGNPWESPWGDTVPATLNNFCCLDGCKHYHELLMYGGAIGAEPDVRIYRYCVGFAGETFDLTEGCCYACTNYSPRLFHLKRRVVVKRRLLEARRRKEGRVRRTFIERFYERLYKLFAKESEEVLPPDRTGANNA